jgi:hypothetical protein
MINYTEAFIEKVSVHYIGNKYNGEELITSTTELNLTDDTLRRLLTTFFLPHFPADEFYSFTFSNGDFTMNPMYTYATRIFHDLRDFHTNSINVAKHLFEVSSHPQIKPGELFVARFTNLCIDDEIIDAIGLFKVENKQTFLKATTDFDDVYLKYEDGINIDKIDKGCLIFNTEKENGLKVCIVDKLNKANDAQYWKDNFLQLTPCNDNYHQTKNFLNVAKNFVTTQLKDEFEMSKTDQIDMLNRSINYFKQHEQFDQDGFAEEVLQDKKMVQSFKKYNDERKESFPVEIEENFEISPVAVKKQQKLFKSVLKLDDNFQIYIHGDKSLIEQGRERDGRKFYKLYYNHEM